MAKTTKKNVQVPLETVLWNCRVALRGIGSTEKNRDAVIGLVFLKFAGEDPEETPMHIHRIDVYAKNPDAEEGKTEFVSLDGLGKDIL